MATRIIYFHWSFYRFTVFLLACIANMPLHAEQVCYHADAGNSEIKFQFNIERSRFTGYFTNFHAEYCWDDNAPETGKIDVTVDISSVSTGNSDLDIGMQEKEGLDTNDFPKAVWTTQSINKDGNGYAIEGKLTLRDVTRHESGRFQLAKEEGGWRLTGAALVKRLDYHIGIGEFADTDFIPNDVNIEFSFVLQP